MNRKINRYINRENEKMAVLFNKRKINLKTMTASQYFGDIKTINIGGNKIVYLGDVLIFDGLKERLLNPITR